MVDLIEAAKSADLWAARRFPGHTRVGELLGVAWEGASKAPAEFAARKAKRAVLDWLRQETRCRVTASAVQFSALTGYEGREDETHEPDRFDRLRWILSVAGLTHIQASALHGWAHDRPVSDEAHRLGVSKNRVNQLRHRAMDRLGGAL